MASGFGLLFVVLGLVIWFDVGEMSGGEQPEMTGVVVAAIGASIILASAWLARNRPDDTPWIHQNEDLFGGE